MDKQGRRYILPILWATDKEEIVINNVVLIGRLVRDPELRYIPVSGRAVCNFTLAVDKGLSKEKKKEMEDNNQPTADFIDIVTWGAVAENSANYLSQGRLVAVQGRIQTGSYEDREGIRRKTVEVNAYSVKFLEWGDSDKQETSNQESKEDDGFGGIDGFHPTDNTDIPF